jgi:protein-disulfide isomerase
LSFLPFLNFKFLNNYKNSDSYIFTISSIAVLVSLILSLISATQIDKVCILCVITYLLNIFILVASTNKKPFLSHYKNTVNDVILFLSNRLNLIITVIAACLFAGVIYYVDTSSIFVSQNPFAGITENSSKYAPAGNILGAKNPKLTIHEYTDYECPFCAISHAMMERLVQEVPNVQVVHHDFPLNPTCNPIVKKSVHKNSCKAALYSRAAKSQGKFCKFSSKLFDNQQDLSEAKILKIANELGLDTNKLKNEANDPVAKEQLITDSKEAANLGITSTPTFFIGMKKYEGIIPYPELKTIVLSNLK